MMRCHRFYTGLQGVRPLSRRTQPSQDHQGHFLSITKFVGCHLATAATCCSCLASDCQQQILFFTWQLVPLLLSSLVILQATYTCIRRLKDGGRHVTTSTVHMSIVEFVCCCQHLLSMACRACTVSVFHVLGKQHVHSTSHILVFFVLERTSGRLQGTRQATLPITRHLDERSSPRVRCNILD